MKKQPLLFTFYFLLFTACLMPAQAQVSADDNAVVSAQPSGGASSFTIDNFTVPAGNNVALLIASRTGGSATITNINFNGTNYTTENIGTASSGNNRTEIWAIELGNIGSALNNQTITISISSSVNVHGAFAATFTNVNQTTPANNFTFESAGDLSIDVSSSPGDMVIDLIGASDTPNFSIGANQTILIHNAIVNIGGAVKISGSYELSSGASTAMSWTNSGGSNNLLHAGANIQSNGVLPVEMTNFKAWQSEDNVELAWTTASEVNNEGFEIEQKAGDTEWRFLDFVPGSGTSFEEQSYSFLHTAPSRGLNYYRLKQLDFDGSSEYSPVVSVDLTNFENLSNLKIAPNPVANGTLTLSLPDTDFEEGFLDLFDSKGVKVLSRPVTNQTTDLDVRFLAKGIYWLGMRTDGEAFWEKVVVE